LFYRLGVFKVIFLIFIAHSHFLYHFLMLLLGDMFLNNLRRWILSLFELPIDLFVGSLIWTPSRIRVSVRIIGFASLGLLTPLRPGRSYHRLIIWAMLRRGYWSLIIYYSSCPESWCLIINTAFIAMSRRFSYMVLFIRIIMSLNRRW
jgi:hypothetical protein